jgi:hypothetical protein
VERKHWHTALQANGPSGGKFTLRLEDHPVLMLDQQIDSERIKTNKTPATNLM